MIRIIREKSWRKILRFCCQKDAAAVRYWCGEGGFASIVRRHVVMPPYESTTGKYPQGGVTTPRRPTNAMVSANRCRGRCPHRPAQSTVMPSLYGGRGTPRVLVSLCSTAFTPPLQQQNETHTVARNTPPQQRKETVRGKDGLFSKGERGNSERIEWYQSKGSFRSRPQKNRATVPGPVWLPMVVPT